MIKTKQLLLASTMVAMAGTALAADSATGTVFFHGVVEPETCLLTAPNVDVNMPVAYTSILRVVGDTSGMTPFNIAATCAPLAGPHGPDVTLKLDATGATVITGTGKLRNTAAVTPAAGVSIELLDETGLIALDPWAAVGSQGFDAVAFDTTSTGSYVWPLQAQYLVTTVPVSAGNVEAQIGFTVSYN